MKELFKNPIFWGVFLFLGGMVVGGIGWDKLDSTLAWRTQGSVFMIVTGIAMIIAGGIIIFTNRSK